MHAAVNGRKSLKASNAKWPASKRRPLSQTRETRLIRVFQRFSTVDGGTAAEVILGVVPVVRLRAVYNQLFVTCSPR
jgi:hypothetical protein